MNVKNFLTLAAVVSLVYGLPYFLSPQGSANVYGYGEVTTPLSNLVLQFFAISMIATGVMCFIARNAERSVGRSAVLWYIAVSQLLFLYMDIRTMLAGDEGGMNYVDLVVNVVLGFGALYFISQDRKARAAA
ncbi:MAG: hypothetical protein ACYTF5_22285 [Planctomycetota bacterium]|jgi:Na+-driven multidrug efflux pump